MASLFLVASNKALQWADEQLQHAATEDTHMWCVLGLSAHLVVA